MNNYFNKTYMPTDGGGTGNGEVNRVEWTPIYNCGGVCIWIEKNQDKKIIGMTSDLTGRTIIYYTSHAPSLQSQVEQLTAGIRQVLEDDDCNLNGKAIDILTSLIK